MNKIKNEIKDIIGILANMLKYQIVTKTILILIISPLFWIIINLLMKSKGIEIINTKNLFGFIFSIQGILFILLSICFIIITFLLEVYGYIIISSLKINSRKEANFIDIIKSSFKIIPNLIKGSIFLILYLGLFIPLIGLDIGISLFKNLKIPNFIFSVILSNNLYFYLYIFFIILISIIIFMSIFMFHYIIIYNYKIVKSIRESFKLVRKNFKDLLFKIIFLFILFIILSFIIIVPVYLIIYLTNNIKFMALFLMLLFNLFILFLNFIIIPIIMYLLTKLFYKYTKTDKYIYVKEKTKETLIDEIFNKKRIIIIVTIIIIIFLSIILSIVSMLNFNLYSNNKDIKIVAHRAGVENENTLKAIKRAIDKKVDYVEIDVQRTKDGNYILNHDKTFKRVAGVNKKPSDMTLYDIKQLSIDVPTLEEVLKISKDKIGIFVELKGETADDKMVDDIVKLINNYNMRNQVILMSLNYNNIEYIEKKYPEFDSGYTYFFAFGDMTKLKGDYLIIEEGLSTNENIEKIHNSGKKVAVWTVNNDESMEIFINTDVDAIITDYYEKLIEKINILNNKTTFEKIIDELK